MAHAQTEKVTWESKTKKIDNSTYEVQLIADVEDGWYIYSQFIDDGGPVPTKVTFDGNGFQLSGDVKEESDNTKEGMDPTFNIELKKFGDTVIFTQLVEKTSKNAEMEANITFMSCNDDMCLPPKNVSVQVSLD